MHVLFDLLDLYFYYAEVLTFVPSLCSTVLYIKCSASTLLYMLHIFT